MLQMITLYKSSVQFTWFFHEKKQQQKASCLKDLNRPSRRLESVAFFKKNNIYLRPNKYNSTN